MNPLRLTAPAKINLGLEILRRRDDGYHDLNTIFAEIGLHDRLQLWRRDDGAITCAVDGEFSVDAGGSNLAVRAAEVFRREFGRPEHGVDILLSKHIPIGAGLGGGSSDAAAMLRALGELWEVPVDRTRLSALAAELGSDVPFFLDGGLAHASGRGEQLRRLDLELPWTVVVINPGIHISTAEAYAAIDRSMGREPTDLVAALERGIAEPALLHESIFNDFESAIFAAHPLLAELKFRLYEAGAVLALMSGSGSTIFALFESAEQAAAAVEQLDGYWGREAGKPGRWDDGTMGRWDDGKINPANS